MILFYFRLKSTLADLAAKIIIAYFVESQIKRTKFLSYRKTKPYV